MDRRMRSLVCVLIVAPVTVTGKMAELGLLLPGVRGNASPKPYILNDLVIVTTAVMRSSAHIGLDTIQATTFTIRLINGEARSREQRYNRINSQLCPLEGGLRCAGLRLFLRATSPSQLYHVYSLHHVLPSCRRNPT
ncbi:uncharacterized protein F5Z01DRAFT_495554 [Emericellopsis atlantica]|uniref:Secreted protein n=1 Tax=Emericellopsis atlantica TaxID=2614577 RepID=A0A9P7ZDD4_9HYPO|nr:uncharacterized protein F5Z01DRAFT_495554 [Emericellopsis atlantica]KAG9249500.1 hypothetical protein F5Z01DRAFT_495554 [Emericellopsis atlantica]